MCPVSPRLADCRPRLPLGAGHSGGELGVQADGDVALLRFAPVAGSAHRRYAGAAPASPPVAGRRDDSAQRLHIKFRISRRRVARALAGRPEGSLAARSLAVSGRTHQALAGGSIPSGLPATGPSSTSAISTTTASPPVATTPSSSPISPPHNKHPPKDQQQPRIRVRRSVMLTTRRTSDQTTGPQRRPDAHAEMSISAARISIRRLAYPLTVRWTGP